MSQLEIGKAAPKFLLEATNESGYFQLSEYLGKFVVLFFYPKDESPGCTKEVCTFRDHLSFIIEENTIPTVIAGVSPDSLASHLQFSEKHKLSYPLLSDIDHKVASDYGVWGPVKFLSRDYPSVIRSTFIINPLGEICKIYFNVSLNGHVEMVMDDLNSEKRRFKDMH